MPFLDKVVEYVLGVPLDIPQVQFLDKVICPSLCNDTGES